MRLISGLRLLTSLLSRMYLGVVLGLAMWAILPLVIGWTPTVVMSGSMLPNLMIGDIVVAQNLSDEEKKVIEVGHVLLAKDPSHPDKLVTHRVINVIKGAGYITKGDANALADPTTIPIANVQGLERLRIPMIGLPIQAFRMGNALPMAIFIGITIFAQLMVMLDRTAVKREETKQTTPPQGKASHYVHPSIVRTLMRCSGIALASIAVVSSSLTAASSTATFSATSPSNGSNFKAMSNFGASYFASILADSPQIYYRLNEASGPTVTDSSGNGKSNEKDARYSPSGIAYGVPSALSKDTSNKAVTLDGKTGTVTSNRVTSESQLLTVQLWFKTTSQSGGKLIGFTPGSVNSTETDRVIYMTSAGKVAFGIDSATKKTITSVNSYNDGKWHMVTVTLAGPVAALYVDGQLVSTGITTGSPSDVSGYWIVGGGDFTGWANQPASSHFAGSIDEVAIFGKSLPLARILNLLSIA